MYAHKICEDMLPAAEGRELIYFENGKPVPRALSVVNQNFVKEQIRIIKSAIKIHVPNTEIFKDGDTYRLPNPESDDNYLKLPYQTLWLTFDVDQKFHGDVAKYAMLVLGPETGRPEEPPKIMIMVSAYMPDQRGWSVAPFVLGLSTDIYNKEYGLPSPWVHPIYHQEKDHLVADGRIANGWDRWHFGVSFCLFAGTIGLMNCKNIELNKVPAPKKLNKKRMKKGRLPLYSYHTLVLTNSRKKTGKKGDRPRESKGINRLHLCRGHFKTFTEDAPLFGSATGRYWWAPHARGNKKKGVVMKDYQIKD